MLAVDAAGKIPVYQPAIRLAVGRAQRLPQAIELDGTLGDEVIVAVRCPAASPRRPSWRPPNAP